MRLRANHVDRAGAVTVGTLVTRSISFCVAEKAQQLYASAACIQTE
jgi:hypothetical protein